MHEAQLHDANSFVTLTYAEEHLPPGGSLRKADFQRFMKRLRKRIAGKVRFFHCGEYGEELNRPHYHALLFGYDFPDRTPWAERGAHRTYRSEELEELWPMGHSEIGDVTFESAAYVARYCVKKITGAKADEHYVDKSTGLIREPEYATMSRRPGIGAGWFEKYKADVYPSDEVVSRGHGSKPPRYYDQLLGREDPELLEQMKAARNRARSREDETPDRLAVREACTASRLSFSQRRLEEC